MTPLEVLLTDIIGAMPYVPLGKERTNDDRLIRFSTKCSD